MKSCRYLPRKFRAARVDAWTRKKTTRARTLLTDCTRPPTATATTKSPFTAVVVTGIYALRSSTRRRVYHTSVRAQQQQQLTAAFGGWPRYRRTKVTRAYTRHVWIYIYIYAATRGHPCFFGPGARKLLSCGRGYGIDVSGGGGSDGGSATRHAADSAPPRGPSSPLHRAVSRRPMRRVFKGWPRPAAATTSDDDVQYRRPLLPSSGKGHDRPGGRARGRPIMSPLCTERARLFAENWWLFGMCSQDVPVRRISNVVMMRSVII